MLKELIENARFLVIETGNQVKLTYGLLNDFNDDLLEKIASKDDYIDNLKTTIEDKCFSSIHRHDHLSEKKINTVVRSILIICVNLERIGDFCVNIARQIHYLSEYSFIHRYDYKSMFTEIQNALSKIMPVFDSRDLGGALDICRSEYNLDLLYKQNFDKIMDELHQGKDIGNLITVVFIFRYLERVGDSLLNIGESLIFSIIGDRIKIRHFEALQKTLEESGFKGTISDIDFASIWGSRSGCRISRVTNKSPSGFKAQGIFKEGDIKKIRKEQKNIQRWNDIFPGLAPNIFGYYEKYETASLLIEYLPGCTLDQIFLTEGDDIIQNVLFIFEQTVSDIWKNTKCEGQFQTDYMQQLKSRMEATLRVHPRFSRSEKHIGLLRVCSTEELIRICSEIEKSVPAPFTIFIHGDFNSNNIVYDHSAQQIHYIDLYRSKDADYIQDASVFLVSNFRLPVFEKKIRERLNKLVEHFFNVFSFYAQNNNDKTFHIRMALALARSFYTSSRFELNYAFAKEMFLRSHYLMEKIVSYKEDNWETFKIPVTILFY